MENDELKPCPFCGGDAEIDTSQSFRHYQNGQLLDQVSVYCVDCSANISWYPGYLNLDRCETIEFCIEAWNARV